MTALLHRLTQETRLGVGTKADANRLSLLFVDTTVQNRHTLTQLTFYNGNPL
jgi:hypothetical protein